MPRRKSTTLREKREAEAGVEVRETIENLMPGIGIIGEKTDGTVEATDGEMIRGTETMGATAMTAIGGIVRMIGTEGDSKAAIESSFVVDQ